MSKVWKILISINVASIAIFFILFGNVSSEVSVDTKKQTEEVKKEETKEKKNDGIVPSEEKRKEVQEEKKTTEFLYPKLNDVVELSNGLDIILLELTETQERNQFWEDKNQVLIAKMEVTNNSSASQYLSRNNFDIFDANNYQGGVYPGGDSIIEVQAGRKNFVNFYFGIDGEGPYQLQTENVIWK